MQDANPDNTTDDDNAVPEHRDASHLFASPEPTAYNPNVARAFGVWLHVVETYLDAALVRPRVTLRRRLDIPLPLTPTLADLEMRVADMVAYHVTAYPGFRR